MDNFINRLIANSNLVFEWASCLVEEETDMFQPSAVIKPLKNPIFSRKDLLSLDIFCDECIRQISYINLFPDCHVYKHTHKDASYFVMKNQTPIFYPAEREYKTTHFVLETNDQAYFVFGNKKYTWQIGRFDILDVVNIEHYAYNPGSTNIKFLYFDYY